MKNLLRFLPLLILVTLVSCGPTVYKTSNFTEVAKTHKTVAILPVSVSMQLRPNEMKKMSPDEMQNLTEATSRAIQEKLYGWFLRRSSKEEFTVDFQDVSQTNALLHDANINYSHLQNISKSELAKLLGVDAVISTSVRTNKPMSEGVAVAMGLAFGVWGNTNNAFTTINIHEGNKGNLLWKYDYEASGSFGSSPERLVNALMRNASKKFPYNAKG